MSNPLEIFYIEDDVNIAQAVKEYFEQFVMRSLWIKRNYQYFISRKEQSYGNIKMRRSQKSLWL